MTQKTYRFYSRQPAENSISNFLLIKEAYKSFRKKKYRDSILLLEGVIDSGERDPYPYVLFALSLLLTNQFSRADSALKRLRMIDPEYRPYLHLDLFLFLKSAATLESVVSRYVNVLNRYPEDRYVAKMLRYLRDVRDFNDFQKKARLQDFVYLPKPQKSAFAAGHRDTVDRGKASGKRVLLLIVVISMAVLAVAILYPNRRTLYEYIRGEKVSDAKRVRDIDRINLGFSRYNLFTKINRKKTDIFYHSNESVERDFNSAKHLIKKGAYNNALMLLNKLNNSNVNLMVKERVEFLIKFILDVDERNYQAVSYHKVVKTPFLYKGFAIRWTGKIANLRRKDGRLFFNLLVGYRDVNIFSGVTDVYAEEDVEEIENGDIVEIKAVLINIIGDERRLYLVAKDIEKM
jgi:hypothetical protein